MSSLLSYPKASLSCLRHPASSTRPPGLLEGPRSTRLRMVAGLSASRKGKSPPLHRNTTAECTGTPLLSAQEHPYWMHRNTPTKFTGTPQLNAEEHHYWMHRNTTIECTGTSLLNAQEHHYWMHRNITTECVTNLGLNPCLLRRTVLANRAKRH
jgi:hypothetical protein